MDVGAHLLARNQTLASDPLMIRLRTEYTARRAAEEAAQREATTAEEASRFAPPPGGWPAPTGCDCAQCRGLARRGLLEAVPRQEISRAW
jgi:hypothetical protein